ncbi:TPA: nuclear transport factor 2 family protein [Pseudomonas aeruginosa]
MITQELIATIIDAFNTHDIDKVLEHFHDEGEMISAAGNSGRGVSLIGKPLIEEALKTRFSASPDIKWTEGKTQIFGSTAVTTFRVTATLPSGDKLDSFGCDLWTFSEGKVLRKDTYYKQ